MIMMKLLLVTGVSLFVLAHCDPMVSKKKRMMKKQGKHKTKPTAAAKKSKASLSSSGIIPPFDMEAFFVLKASGVWRPLLEPYFIPDLEIWDNIVGMNETA
jgi:hypothetical protein